MRWRQLRRDLASPLHQRASGLGWLATGQEQAEHAQGVRMLWRNGQHVPVELFGLRQVTGPMEFDSLSQGIQSSRKNFLFLQGVTSRVPGSFHTKSVARLKPSNRSRQDNVIQPKTKCRRLRQNGTYLDEKILQRTLQELLASFPKS